MTSRASIGLGDLIGAVRSLELTDPGEVAAIAGLLGVPTPGRVAPREEPRADAPRSTAPQAELAAPSGTGSPPVPRPDALAPEELFRPRLVERPPMLARAPAWTREVSPIPLGGSLAGVSLPHAPLFEPVRTRSILSAALARYAEEVGVVDTEAILTRLARGEALAPIPWERRATLSGGFQVLIDRSEVMRPLHRDAEELVQRMSAVCGRDRVEVLGFEHDPAEGVITATSEEWAPWSPPLRGTTVVVLGDLGIGSRDSAAVRSWVNLAERASDAGCPVVAIVPYGPRRWPASLVRALQVLHWDRKQTVGHAVRTARARRPRGR